MNLTPPICQILIAKFIKVNSLTLLFFVCFIFVPFLFQYTPVFSLPPRQFLSGKTLISPKIFSYGRWSISWPKAFNQISRGLEIVGEVGRGHFWNLLIGGVLVAEEIAGYCDVRASFGNAKSVAEAGEHWAGNNL